MQVTETLSDGLKRGFTVVLPATDIEGRRTARLADIGKNLRLPGFRPGKVPMPLVKQRYGTAVIAEVLQESVNEAMQKVISDRGLRPAGQPKVELSDFGEPTAALEKDLEFKVEMEVLPDIQMPDFSAITLTRLRADATPEAVDRALDQIATRNRELQDIEEDRGAEKGEVLTVDFLGKIDGEPFEGGAATDATVEVAGEGFVPGFTQQLEGVKVGETRIINVAFPPDYGATALAGKDATFDITVKALKRPVLPPIDDDLAKKMGLTTLDAAKEMIIQQIQREYDHLARLRIKRQLLDALAIQADFVLPESMVEAEFNQIWQRIETNMKEGRQDDEDKDKDEVTLRAEYRAIAERRVRLGLLLADIGRVNGLSVSQEELTRAMRVEAMRYPGQEVQVMDFFRKNQQAVESLRGPIFEDKVVDYVLELAQVTDETTTPEVLASAPEA